MAAAYCPRRGDVIWLSFDLQPGYEQAGRRPALVLSPESYNGKVGLALLCPITSQAKGYPFEVPLVMGAAIKGVALADQVKSLDWRARQAEYAGTIPATTLDEVLAKLRTLLGET